VSGGEPTVEFPEMWRRSRRLQPLRRRDVRSWGLGRGLTERLLRLLDRSGGSLVRSMVGTGLLVAAIVIVAEIWLANGLVMGHPLPSAVALLVALQLLGLRAFRVHRRSWRFTGLADVLAIAGGLTLGTGCYAVIHGVADVLGVTLPTALPLGLLLTALLLAINLKVIARIARRLQAQRAGQGTGQRTGQRSHGADGPPDGTTQAPPQHRALVIGAGRVAVGVIRDATLHHGVPPRIVGLLDDTTRAGELVAGAPVLGRTKDLEQLSRSHGVTLLIIALDRPEPELLRQVIVRAQRLGLAVRIRPAEPLAGLDREALVVRDVELGDLLPRPPAVLDGDGIEQLVAGRTVVVTGAAGSIGSELSRQLLRHGPSRLVLIDRSEYGLWALEQELTGDAPSGVIEPVILDVRDGERITDLFQRRSPSVVFHAAALKHVPLLERNVIAAVINNVIGTHHVTEAALDAGVTRLVLVSSDKAVTPSSVMGATKRIAERLVADAAARSGRDFISVRFGNVLGSSGSVLEVFQAQLAAGGPLTVTDPEMTRYFMTIPEASGLVLHAAALQGQRGTLTLDMGQPVRIVDIAEDLVRLHGLEPGTDVEIVITGARPGEKLHEQLSSPDERLEATGHPSILAITGSGGPWWGRDLALAELEALARRSDVDALRGRLFALAAEHDEPVATAAAHAS
jgi:FlaA1/EpsC-like NDP-sugar epimerase